jgi:membrane-associated protease RseP (regulator of RpoE activity)
LGLALKPGANDGAVVEQVTKDSPAEKAGIKNDDRIIQIGGSPVKTARDLMSAMRKMKKGDKAQVVVERSGASVSLEVQLGEPGKPAEPEQPFGEPGKALIALAQKFEDASDKAGKKRDVSWKADAKSITIKMHLKNRERLADFLEQAADVMDQFPKDEIVTVTLAAEARFSLGKGVAADVSITLKKHEAASDASKKDAPPGDAAKSKDDAGDKAKTPDKPKRERKPRSARHRQAA